MNAWSNSNQMILGQEKSNEITAIPKLLDLLELEGAIVTIDAMGGQTVISERIVDKVADYILAGKDNQKFLLDDIKDTFAQTPNIVCHTSIEKSRGRMKKNCSVIMDMVWITKTSNWKNLSSIIMIESQRTRIQTGEGEQSNGYIYQAYLKQADLNMIIRGHWGIESNLH